MLSYVPAFKTYGKVNAKTLLSRVLWSCQPYKAVCMYAYVPYVCMFICIANHKDLSVYIWRSHKRPRQTQAERVTEEQTEEISI